MPLMFGIDHGRWVVTFLKTETGLSPYDRLYLMLQATEMYLSREEERAVRGETFEGVLHRTGKYQLLGTFGGQEFKAEVETDKGKKDLAFLVTEKVNPNLN